MNLNQLYYFRELAHLEHYTKAAEQLSVSQPTLSHAIATMEQELGVFLFEKQGRNVVLTKYGRIYLSYVEKALKELELGKKQMEEMASSSCGRIDLAFISTVGAYFIPNLITAFLSRESNKGITFFCSEGNTAELLENLKKEKYQMVFCSKNESDPEIEFIPVLEQQMVLIMPPNHPLAERTTIDLAETKPYPFIYCTKENGLRPMVDRMFETAGFRPQITCEVEEDNAIAGLVSANLGLAVVTDSATVRNFGLKIIPLAAPNCKRRVYLASVKNRYLPPAAQQFKNYVAERYSLAER